MLDSPDRHAGTAVTFRPLRAGGLVRPAGDGSCLALGLTLGLTLLVAPRAAAQQVDSTGICADGSISEIQIFPEEVFDVDQVGNVLLKGFFGFMNALHVTTKPSFIRSELLFTEGDCYDPFRLEESERLIRNQRFIGPVDISAEDLADGNKRVVVRTRDEWSTQIDLGISYDQGFNLEVLELTEENFLGHGLFLSGEYQEYRERRDVWARLQTQRFFGRADANILYGSGRAGTLAIQDITYPFVGEVGLLAGREHFQQRTDYFRYATDEAEPFTHVLLPVVDERFELSGARRFGRPGRFLMIGASLTRDVFDYELPQLAYSGDFEGSLPDTLGESSEIARQLSPLGATRLSGHFAARRVYFREYQGLDALSAVRDVELGTEAGITLGKSVPVFEPTNQRAAHDLFARGRFRAGFPFGESIALGNLMFESRYEGGAWRDVLAEADIFAYGRASWLPYQTFFARASYAGGYRTTIPYQMALGGRDAVRSLRDDRYPGGESVIFTLEDRVYSGWPGWSALDLGFTLFSDVGRIWAGDVPYGVDSPWQMALGVGLRLGLPSGTSNVIRMDFAFPVDGSGAGPVFRVTLFERHGLHRGFSEDLLRRSRRFDIGPEYFN